MGEGLAAQAAGVTNTYGSGDGQNSIHYYAGVMKKKISNNKGKYWQQD